MDACDFPSLHEFNCLFPAVALDESYDCSSLVGDMFYLQNEVLPFPG